MEDSFPSLFFLFLEKDGILNFFFFFFSFVGDGCSLVGEPWKINQKCFTYAKYCVDMREIYFYLHFRQNEQLLEHIIS